MNITLTITRKDYNNIEKEVTIFKEWAEMEGNYLDIDMLYYDFIKPILMSYGLPEKDIIRYFNNLSESEDNKRI